MEEVVFSLHSCKILNLFVMNSQVSWKHANFLSSLPFCESFKDAFALSYFHLAVRLREWKLAEKTVPLCVVLTTYSKPGMAN